MEVGEKRLIGSVDGLSFASGADGWAGGGGGRVKLVQAQPVA